jgi:hypothetical protein
VDFEGIRPESVVCIHLTVDMNERSYVLASLVLNFCGLSYMEQQSAMEHIGVKGVEYLSCTSSVDQADCM